MYCLLYVLQIMRWVQRIYDEGQISIHHITPGTFSDASCKSGSIILTNQTEHQMQCMWKAFTQFQLMHKVQKSGLSSNTKTEQWSLSLHSQEQKSARSISIQGDATIPDACCRGSDLT